MAIEFNKLKTGDELPKLVKGPVTRQHLVEWCAASGVTLVTASKPSQSRAASSVSKRFGMLWPSQKAPSRVGSTSTAPTISTPSIASKWVA